MEEGDFVYTSPVTQNLEAKIGARISVKKIREVVHDMLSGGFNGKTMRVESKDIPIHTTRKSSPQMIRFGVELFGTTRNNEDNIPDYVRPYISNESREKLLIEYGYIRSGSVRLDACTIDELQIAPNSRHTFTIFEDSRHEVEFFDDVDDDDGNMVFDFDITGNKTICVMHIAHAITIRGH